MHRLHNRRDLLLFVPPIHLEEAEMDQNFVLHIIVGVQPGLRSFILRWRLFGYLSFCFVCLFYRVARILPMDLCFLWTSEDYCFAMQDSSNSSSRI